MDAGRLGPPTCKTIFYTDDGVLHGPDPVQLQQGLNLLGTLFATFGLSLNHQKTKFITMEGGRPYLHLSDEAYHFRQTDDGNAYLSCQQRSVTCPHCLTSLQFRSLRRYLQMKHPTVMASAAPTPVSHPVPPSQLTVPPELFVVSMPTRKFCIECPVPGCPGKATDRFSLHCHFFFRHLTHTICIHKEGQLPCCPTCSLFCIDSTAHCSSALCVAGSKRLSKSHQQLTIATTQSTTPTAFYINNKPIDRVPHFKYLGQMVSEDDDDWLAVHTNLSCARKRWSTLSRILSAEGASPTIMATFYKSIIQSLLLYGSETWVLSLQLLKSLSGFHHHCIRMFTRTFITTLTNGRWSYPTTSGLLDKDKIYSLSTYINRCHRTISHFAYTRAIYRRCIASKPLATNANQLVWWIPSASNRVAMAPHGAAFDNS